MTTGHTQTKIIKNGRGHTHEWCYVLYGLLNGIGGFEKNIYISNLFFNTQMVLRKLTKEEAKEEVKKLVDKYNRIRESDSIKRYKEEDTKAEFIEPLFEALGWDVRNTENDDEVVREEKISKGRVDYSFRINGIPKFFLEAKALKEDLDNIKFVEQAVNYSWHKGCTWAVLTDFEAIKIFNAEWKSANPLQAQFGQTLPCQLFLEKFDTLWLLSRDSFEKKLLDIEAEKWGKKIKKTSVDKQLLGDLTRFRDLLNKNILKNNASKNISGDELDEAVQRIIDRLIFIRTLEDKELEAPMLQSVIREDLNKRIYKKLNLIFRKIDDIYNSKPFTPHLCEDLDIDDEDLSKIISGLFATSDNSVRYDFSAIDADVLGNIYEQYLGHILKKTDKRAKLAEGKAHRKEQGIYYTPTYVVDYIVKNTIGELAKDKKFDLKNIKILDPACGSGSFLMKAFDYLVTLDKKKNGEVDQTKLDLTGASATYGRKVEILKDNIFGVDLDPKAAEIAQLNLLLKAAEKKNRLPTLQDNIKVGNSLIDDSAIAGERAFKWEEQFKDIMQNGGFDVVIGNPPYINAIQLTKTVGEKTKQFWKNKFASARGTYDIYILFFEQAMNLCKDGGYVSFITPNKYLSSPYGIALRELISEKYKLIKMVDLSRVRVFNDPSVYPIITVIQKVKPTREYTITTERMLSEDVLNKKIYKVSSKNLTTLPDKIWGLILSDNLDIIEKVFDKSRPLEEFSEVQATSTAAEADEFSKYISESNDIAIINTGTIDRYTTTYGYTKFMNKGERLFKPTLKLAKVNENRRELYTSSKIIIAKLALRIEGFVDVNGEYSSINTNCIHTPKNGIKLEYLAGIINSKMLSFIYSEIFSGLKMSGGYFQFQAPQLRILPIVIGSEQQQTKIVEFVKNIISLNQSLSKLKNKSTDEKARLEKEIKKLDAEIDEEIYKLYGITDKEKKIIEDNLK